MSTLVEELESAAQQIDCHCRDFGKPCRRELEAARLRQRAAWVREIEQTQLADCDPHAVAMFRAICGAAETKVTP